VSAGYQYRSLEFTETFLETYASRDFSKSDRSRFRKALRLLDESEEHPSLRMHKLEGDRAGSWSVSASTQLRMTFQRLPDGRKAMLTCSRHYDR
jgi:plasmid maintenance system killer protein